MCSKLAATLFFFFFFFFPTLNFLVESFGLLNELFPLPSILDPGYSVFIFIWQIACLMLSSHLYLGVPRDLLVRGFQLNIFLTVVVSGIHCTRPNKFSFVLQTCSYFLHFVPGAEIPSRKFWPSQRTLSTSLDPGHGLSSY